MATYRKRQGKRQSGNARRKRSIATTDRDMNIEEIKKTFGEIRELRKKAQEKEDSLIEALVSDGQLSAIEAILVKTPGFGGDKMTEAFVMSVLSKKENQ